MYTRLFSLLAAVSLLSMPVTSVLASLSFPDVLDTHPNAEAISYAKETGLVQGYSDNTYQPDRNMNRAEFTKIIVSALFPSHEIHVCLETPFGTALSDVPTDAWFAPFVCMGRLHGIITGNPDGTFLPANTINVAEAGTIIARAFKLEQPNTNVWYEGPIRAMSAISALPSSFTSFTDPVTRGEMAEMVFRVQTGNTSKESTSYEKLSGITQDDSSGGGFTYQNYTDGVLDEGQEVVLFFHAQWCPFCRVNHERLLKLEKEGILGLPVYKVDYDNADELRKRFAINQQDTFLRIDEAGQILDEITFPSYSVLSAFVE